MIELSNVFKRFDDFTVLDNVNLTIPSGTAFGLLGSNGAGKSTILRLLCGIYTEDEGTVSIDGEEAYNNPKVKERVFFINDETIQFGKFTLKGLKNFYKGFYPNFSEELFERLRSTINLPLNKKINTFSKGMKRQAIMIVGLACQTDYLLLDEAFDGLDPTMRIIVKRMLVDAMLDRNLTTIISSHNLKEINELCDSVALIHKGSVVFNSDLDSVKSNVHKVQVVFPQLDSALPQQYIAQDFPDLDILHFDHQQSVYHFIIRGDEDKIHEQFASKNPVVLEVIPLTLEEIFIYEMEALGYDFNGIDR
jgi:ABC-2 type transport system ATP-binding protein